MGKLFIKSNFNKISLESLLILHVYKACDNDNIQLNILSSNEPVNEKQFFQIDLSNIKHDEIKDESVPDLAKWCIWPVILLENKVIAGLASVARQLIKLSENAAVKSLLGFREACLMSPSESSVWTKFCEIDLIGTINDLFINPKNYYEGSTVFIPKDLTRFECHMSQPVKIHNVYKEARIKNNDKLIKSSVPITELNLNHTFGEGPFMTLADLFLYPCYQIIFKTLGNNVFETGLPLTCSWYKNLEKQPIIPDIKFDFQWDYFLDEPIKIVQEEIIKQSLYASDPTRYNPHNRIYTKQFEVDKSIEKIRNIKIFNEIEPFGAEIDFNWTRIPPAANPFNGALPKSRATRKGEQLENLAKAVLKIVRSEDGMKIVDFCSGSGHLGILLATLLPNCTLILVENKERSLMRAAETISKLKLTNVILIQCNLDYFCADFDLGVSLHACGVATDLVIQMCIKNSAHFVSCPCCYGGIHDCHHLRYPRSEIFRKLLNYKDYLVLGHCADQTHDEENSKTLQGFTCMDSIDTDRKLQAEEHDYTVHLGKLHPVSCTPKNNLLVGLKGV